jgi:carbon storage regulator CsrA
VLVLTRRLNERIVLPGLGVAVCVVAIKGNTVRLGIEAPPDVRVMREELLEGSDVAPPAFVPAREEPLRA